MHCKASEYPGEQVVERFQIEQFKPVSERESRFPVQHGITFDIDGVKDLQAVLASYLATLAPEPDTVRAKKTLFALDGADIMVNHFVHQRVCKNALCHGDGIYKIHKVPAIVFVGEQIYSYIAQRKIDIYDYRFQKPYHRQHHWRYCGLYLRVL